ncbi:polysaccharide biosynthesis tyrosine autokinase [Allosediminivita pacifica]|uniref:non-specific protein-tyrosine kinase n=1 Tax=Allosediminivita pacifica TaxID=1267769 RepID=A0A2T6A964_9RHOB|nr:polysaccharide biosynthesis tyrosine autokinase [Allosediminivita pacifica]PTX40364.1 capsular exopolysaccharide synthesis family protein [Allosediminivita pacifica]GGB26384.1 hypothetical protein GCM10011324_40240 [Allosediminivita pacifica]
MNSSFPNPQVSSSVGMRSASYEDGASALDVGAILGALWRGKWIILISAIGMLMVGIYYAYEVATPRYTASAVVALNSREEQVVDLNSVVSGLSADSSVVNTEVEVLRSRNLMGKVVDTLDLTSDPEFNPQLRDRSIMQRITGQVKSWIRSVLSQPPQTQASGAVLGATEDRSARDTATSLLLGATEVRNIPLSLVFRINVETTNPRKSAAIADTIVDLYIQDQLEAKFEATEKATVWLTDRVSELQVELEEAEASVKEFRSSIDLVSREALIGLERQLKDLRDRAEATETRRDEAAARLATLESAGTPQEQVEALGDSQLEQYLPRLDEPQIAQAFETRLQQIEIRTRQELQRAENQLNALRNSATELETQIDRQSDDFIRLQQLTREAEAVRLLYEYFLSRLKETSAQQGIQQADSRSLSEAVIPGGASAPNKALIFAICLLLGGIAGSVLVLFREARNNVYREPQSLEKGTGYPVMGQVPLLPARRRKDAIRYLAEKPTSAAAEAVRNLRTSVMLSNVDAPPQVIMTTSSLPGEGKTTLAMALTQNFSGMGKRCLIIEGDIRRRVFSQYTQDNDSETGLISVLTGERSLSEVVYHMPQVGADVLRAGKTGTNAADLFASDSFSEVLRAAREQYDQIIIDTPPVLVVPDARIIAQHVDAVLFVVRWDSTQKGQVSEALRMFESVGRPINGTVLNQINPKGMKRYGYGHKYGAYAAYGSKYYVN